MTTSTEECPRCDGKGAEGKEDCCFLCGGRGYIIERSRDVLLLQMKSLRASLIDSEASRKIATSYLTQVYNHHNETIPQGYRELIGEFVKKNGTL